MNARNSLSRQINYRLLLALTLATLFSTLVGFWVYQESNRRAHDARVATLNTHLVGTLAQIERNWGREAYNYRVRLEYTRLLEDSEQRAAKLTDYLTAQGGSSVFPLMRVLDRQGKEVVSYAYESNALPTVVFPPGADSVWHWDSRHKILYRVFRQQIWLDTGNGQLQLFRPVDNSLLHALELPDNNIVLLWEKIPVASSQGNDGIADSAAAITAHGDDPLHWVTWGASAPGQTVPRLFIMPDRMYAFAPGDLAIPLFIATLVFAFAAWAALGRWSVFSLRRVQAIRYAQEQFAEDRSLDNEVEIALTVARGHVDDEIADVADTLLMMMQTIVATEASEIEVRESLQRSEQRFRLLIEGTRAIAWEYDLESDKFVYVSPQAESILGYPLASWAVEGFFACLLPDDERATTLDRRRRILALDAQGTMEYRALRHDGLEIWLQDLTSPLHDDHGRLVRILGLTLDVTERKRAEEKLVLSDLVVRNASEGILITDADNHIIATNPAFESITGYPQDEVIGHNPSMLKSGLQNQAFYQKLWQELLGKGRWSGEVWNRRKTGELYAQRASIVVVPASHRLPARYVALFSDVTLEKQQEEELIYQAAHDPLTGLPNRRLLGDRMESALARARRDNHHVGILILDLDGFKHINDTLGHLMGDHVLIEVAKRIQHTLRETDTLARIGGDEFMILAEGLADQGDLPNIASKILEHIQEPLCIDQAEMYVTTSIGITVFPDDGQTIGELFSNADTALYRAKAEGRNAFRFFTAQMHEAAMARMATETELRRAIPNNEFELYYQPVIELATGKIAKAEALVRWHHPQRGLVPPNDFIPIAEDTGMILPLGIWIVGEAARQAAEWDHRSPPDFKICVNFSAYQFRRSDPIALLADTLATRGINSGHLVIEITESLFMEDEGNSLAQLHLLREQGFEIAIDDFGTGYSSLSYLQRLPVDTLKIDRSFVSGIPGNLKSMALIDAMLSLGHTFGIAVIAEGIETALQADFLRERGCRYGQGFLFGQPMPAAELSRRYFDTASG